MRRMSAKGSFRAPCTGPDNDDPLCAVDPPCVTALPCAAGAPCVRFGAELCALPRGRVLVSWPVWMGACRSDCAVPLVPVLRAFDVDPDVEARDPR
jgi:hypothetical protein